MDNITKFVKPIQLATAAANFIVKTAAEQMAAKGKFAIAISGGSTPNLLFELLASPAYSQQINWDKFYVFWVDERCVPMNSKENNCHNATQLWLYHVPIPIENIFAIPVNLTPKNAAEEYAKTIKTFFKNDFPVFDLVLLGLGADGHTASIFPNSSLITEKVCIVKDTYVEKLKMDRVTLTAPLINTASNIIFMIAGADKTAALQQVLYGKPNATVYPAQLIKPTHGQLCWFIDDAAAEGLDELKN